MKPEDCALILLASGLSQRFGTENKLLADLNGRPVISHVFGTLSDMPFATKVAVIAHDRILEAIAVQEGFESIINIAPEKGQGRSLAFGAQAALDQGVSGAITVLGDMPFITRRHTEGLMAQANDFDAVMSEYEGIKMPPAYFGLKALTALSLNTDHGGGKAALAGLSVSTLPLSAQAARDIDTQEDLALARKLQDIDHARY